MFKNIYFYRARLFPAVLTSIPLLIFVNKVLAIEYSDALRNVFDILPVITHLGLSAALIFFCVQVNRLLAKEIFQRIYFKEELNMPTTNHLLWKSTYYDQLVKKKIHDKVNEKFGIQLLSTNEEQQDELRARNLIVSCVGQVRIALKANPMLLQHNIEYGFWRNLIGGSVLAILFSITIFIYGNAKSLTDLRTVGILLAIVYILPLLFSKMIINRYGKYYSKILYEQFLSL
jgi:hypothetical protein